MEPTKGRSKPSYDDLSNAGGPPEQTTVFGALRGTMPIEITDEQIQRISKAVLTKLPGIAISVVNAVVPVVLQKVYEPYAVEDVEEGKPIVTMELIFSFACSFLISYLVQNKLRENLNIDEWKQTTWDSKQLRAARNWEVGSAIGNFGLGFYQLYEASVGNYGTAMGMIMSFIIQGGKSAYSTSQFDIKAAEGNEKAIANMSEIIREAIDNGLLDVDEVEMYTALLKVQNLIVFNSISQLSTNKFCKFFSKLKINKDEATILKNRLDSLSPNDFQILQKKLVSEEGQEEADNPEEINSLYKEITFIAFDLYNEYRDELKKVIENQSITSDTVKPNFFDSFYQFLSKG